MHVRAIRVCMCTFPTERQPGGGCLRQTVGRQSRHGSTAHATLSRIPERPHSLLLGSLARLQALGRTAYNQAPKRNVCGSTAHVTVNSVATQQRA